jgi:hypothetical protein
MSRIAPRWWQCDASTPATGLLRCIQDDEQPLAFVDIDQLTVFTDNVRETLEILGLFLRKSPLT